MLICLENASFAINIDKNLTIILMSIYLSRFLNNYLFLFLFLGC